MTEPSSRASTSSQGPIVLNENIAGRVRRLEYLAIALTVFSAAARYLVMGGSVAMLASILEDLTELIAPVAILLTLHLDSRPANDRFPYGHQRIGSLSFFGAALALLVLGVLTCWQGVERILSGGIADYGRSTFAGHDIWQGWIMIAVLVVTAAVMLPVMNAKREVAPKLRLAALTTDASSNQAHITVALSAALGIFLTSLGWGWADPAAAILVGGVILFDGWRDLRSAAAELIDESPDQQTMAFLSLIVAGKPYVRSHYWLARKVGRYIDADLFIAADDVPLSQVDSWRDQLQAELRGNLWQLHDLTISFGAVLPNAKEEDHGLIASSQWSKGEGA